MLEQQQADRSPPIATLARGLLEQADRCAAAGLLQQASAVVAQAWSLAQDGAPEVADGAAWQNGWLLLSLGRYDEAADWFHRVERPLAYPVPAWPATIAAVVDLCDRLSQEPIASLLQAASPPAQDRIGRQSPVATTLPPLHITNLGRFQVIRDGQVLPICGARKAIAVLRLLLTRRQGMARKEELMELLWPDGAPRAAAHSLHVAVTTLRRYLDPWQSHTNTYIQYEAGSYMVNPDAPVSVDSIQMRELINAGEQLVRGGELDQAREAYGRALALYQGDYYLDGNLPAWALVERERLLTAYLQALDQLGTLLVCGQQWQAAVECYNQLLARDQYREDAHCQLMRCYWQLGRRAEALQQYERCRVTLANDLGLEPMEETQALYRGLAVVGG